MSELNFKTDAKQIVDMLFNAKVFNEKLTRDDFTKIEDWIDYCMSSRFESVKKVEKIQAMIDSRK